MYQLSPKIKVCIVVSMKVKVLGAHFLMYRKKASAKLKLSDHRARGVYSRPDESRARNRYGSSTISTKEIGKILLVVLNEV
jgi:hypothetical protein